MSFCSASMRLRLTSPSRKFQARNPCIGGRKRGKRISARSFNRTPANGYIRGIHSACVRADLRRRKAPSARRRARPAAVIISVDALRPGALGLLRRGGTGSKVPASSPLIRTACRPSSARWRHADPSNCSRPLIQAAAFDREFRAQLVALGQDFLNRQRNLHFKLAPRQPICPPPKCRRERQRCEPRHQEPQREDHGLFDHAPCSLEISRGIMPLPAARSKLVLRTQFGSPPAKNIQVRPVKRFILCG